MILNFLIAAFSFIEYCCEFIELQPSVKFYRLQNGQIIRGSQILIYNARELSLEEYYMDYWEGVVFLFFSPQPKSKLIVYYSYIKEPIKRVYKKYEPDTVIPLFKTEEIKDEHKRDTLSLSGWRSLSIGLGTGGVSMHEDLTVDVEGKIGEFDISAHLTDEGSAFPQEFATREIEEFERIYFNIKRGNFSVNLGDLPDYPIFGVSENVKGGKIEYKYKTIDLSFGAGIKNGIYTKNVFYGKDGKQGPYKLKGKYGEENISILPGSERVWVNGIEKKRGKNKDYIIDYSQGCMIFTPRKLIQSTDIIEVRFEYLNEDYTTNFISSNFNSSIMDLQISQEKDGMKNRRWNFSPEEIKNFSNDTTGWGFIEGAKWVGDGNGEYIKEGDHYRWVGYGNGNYNVYFTRKEKGAYKYSNGYYYYVGEGKGEYSPLIPVKLPNQRQRFSISFRPNFKMFYGDLNFSLAHKNPNLFNPSFKKTGIGNALLLGLKNDFFDIGFRREHYEKEEYYPTNLDFKWMWGMESLTPPFSSEELFFNAAPEDSFILINGSAGILKGYGNLKKFGGTIDVWRKLKYKCLFTQNIKKQALSVSAPWGVFKPYTEFSYEERDTVKYINVETEFGYEPRKLGYLGVIFQGRRDLKDKKWKNYGYIGLKGLFNAKDGRVEMTTQYKIQKQEVSQLDNLLGNLIVEYTKNSYRLFLDYIRNSLKEEKKRIEYVWVGKGKGNYTYVKESRRYIPCEGGEYIKVEKTEETKNEVMKDQLELEFDFYPLKKFSVNQFFSYEGRMKGEYLINSNSSLIATLHPKWLTIEAFSYFSKNLYLSVGEEKAKDENLTLSLIPKSYITEKFVMEKEIKTEKNLHKGIQEMSNSSNSFYIRPSYYGNLKIGIKFGGIRTQLSGYSNSIIWIMSYNPGFNLQGSFKNFFISIGYDLFYRKPNQEIPKFLKYEYPAGISHRGTLTLDYPFKKNLYITLAATLYQFEGHSDRNFNITLRSYF